MATNAERAERGLTDDMQNLEMSGVPRPAHVSIQDASPGGDLSLRSLRAHYGHLSRHKEYDARCGLCSQGLERAVASREEKLVQRGRDEVAESHGADEERSTTFAPSDRTR